MAGIRERAQRRARLRRRYAYIGGLCFKIDRAGRVAGRPDLGRRKQRR